MKTAVKSSRRLRSFLHTPARRSALLAAIIAITGTASLTAQVIVDTLGGGPFQGNQKSASGFTDGNTFLISQFNEPVGIARDSAGNLYVADRANGAVRKITLPNDSANSETTTLIAGLASLVGVAVDRADNIYVLTSDSLKKYNSFASLLATLGSGLSGATALALDGSTNIYVIQDDGAVKKVTQSGTVTTVASGFNSPKGIAVLDTGLIAVSDTGNDAIRLLNPVTGGVQLLAGGNGAGFTNGPGTLAAFNQPYGVARSPSGTLVVADRLNHRFRLVATNGAVSTLYGVDPTQWSQEFPGWQDGDASLAAAHDPVSATVAPDGTVYTTEVFYQIIRKVTGASLGPLGSTGGGTPGGGTNVVVIPPPAFSPNSGYFPMRVTVTVGSANPVYYTTDGSEPTTSSAQVALSGNVGTIQFNEPLRDLTSLRLKAFAGTNASITVSGVSASVSEIGLGRDMNTGIGSTLVVPLVVNLRSNEQIRSLQFRVEITPLNGAPPVRPNFRALPILTNDFIPLVGASMSGAVATYSTSPYSVGNTRGLVVTAIGAGANFFVQRFGTVAMLAVPIDSAAQQGQRYRVEVLFPTATSDAQQTPVSIAPMPSRTIIITNLSYLVGDVTPAGWYTAGDFGSGDINNNDVNTVFYAAHGVRTPYTFSDTFDAMDSYPLDEPGFVGGDGAIDFFDWQVILRRSLRLDPNNWRRTNQRDADGRVVGNSIATLPPPPPLPGAVWFRQALVSAGSVTDVVPGRVYSLPIFVKVVSGYNLSGLSFRLSLGAGPGAPAPAGVQFYPAAGIPAPITGRGLTGSEIICGWPLDSFIPALRGSNLLGRLEFYVPAGPAAQPGQFYTLRFFNVGGGADLSTPYKLESVPASAWVLSPALRSPELISDEWKTNFFGSLTSPLADAVADPDADGVPNLEEFLAGTNPTDAFSHLQLLRSEWRTGGLALRWLSAPGKTYVIESCLELDGNWNVIASDILGDGNLQEYIDANVTNRAQFYRIRLQP